ncbi:MULTISPECIES: ABC transporter permease [unclassified Marinomonas]|uniref:ABC transporter permease n=1 Tax=unclassified Marinomonas TaxID=196814 RepID=UPI000A887ECA|nr:MULTISPECIES: ABC transporter permease [unclassified Marinomonas]
MNTSLSKPESKQSASIALKRIYDAISIKSILLPLLGSLLFLVFWHVGAAKIDTSLGVFPGPNVVYQQWQSLVDDHVRERDKEIAFYERQEKRNAKKLAKNPDYVVKTRPYTGKPTFFDQIGTSLYTVVAGFALASLIAIPLGILIGLNSSIYSALNPIIQIFKPVSPLAWLPLVTMVVSATYVSADPMFSKSFLTSMFTVTLCCMWPTLINTAVGVAAIEKDLLNVSKVLRLNWLTHVRKIVVPSSIPMMFTGLRLSLGIAWMVLIAAEMLAQNPGLGKFVWDEFQNGSSNSLGRIMVAVLMIGFIGFALDRAMLSLQKIVSWDKSQVLR